MEEKESLDRPLSFSEIETSIKEMQKSKTPGADGLTQEFMWFFWRELSVFFQDLLNEIYEDEILPESQKKGIIKISYKKNGRQHIKNYRPITLLNTDMKIITKTLAKRLANVLKNIIHESQKSVKGRKITENIHLAQDLIDAVLKDKTNAAYIFIDQEKAFDRISHTFLFKTLKRFGFGENLIKWIKIIYKDVTSRVKVNGFLTKPIEIQRGVRQGCPLSALLYVICSEVLTINIRKDANIKGYRLRNGMEHKVAIYADDLNVCVTTEQSIFELFKLFEKYESATNSKINKDKTEALWLGNWIGRTDKPLDLKWTSGDIKFLGVYVGNDRKSASQKTFDEIIDQIKNKISYWNNKSISKKGKVKILNIFGLTKLWYALEIHDISNTTLTELNNLVKSFIWNGYHQRQLSVLCYPYNKGGLSLQNIESKIKSLRIRWLGNLMTKSNLICEKSIVDQLIGNIGNFIFGLNILKYNNNYENIIENSYYKNAYKIWRKSNIIFSPRNYTSIKNDWIYNNILLTDDDGRVFKPPGYYSNNLPTYAPKRFQDLPVRVPIGDLRGVFRTIIPKMNIAFHKIVYSNKTYDLFQIKRVNEELIVDINGPFKDVYECVLLNTIPLVNIWERKWDIEFGRNREIIWSKVWESVHNSIINYKIQSSVWEMIHRNFICGYILRQMGKGDGICKLCNTIEENRTHIFMSCKIINGLYQYLSYIIINLGSIITEKEKAFGIFEQNDANSKLRNYITYSIRHIVYRNRNIQITTHDDILTILVKKVKAYIKNDLTEKYYFYKHNNKLEYYKDTYLIDNLLGKIEDNNIIFLI